MNLLALLVWVPLTFTAPSDSVTGIPGRFKVARYEATMGTLAEVLNETAPSVWLYADTLGGFPFPHVPGTVEHLWVKIPADGVWRRVRVYSYDYKGNRSAGSNVASKMALPAK